MQVGAKQQWESPRDYLGNVTTTGKGIGIMVMDEGFDIRHPDLRNQIATTLATSPDDVFDSDKVGHGSFTLGVVGGDGTSSNGRVQGVAPGARLIPAKLKLSPDDGLEGTAQSFANGVYWAVQNQKEYNIRVINCSFVIPLTDAAGAAQSIHDPLGWAIDLATKAGIVIVAGVGNFGKEAGVGTPAGHPDVIAVGALDTSGTPHDHSDDTVPAFSSRGLSLTGESKPDILAPGVRIMSVNTPDSVFERSNAEMLAKARLALDGSSDELRGLARELIEAGRLDPIALKAEDEKLRRMVVRRFDVHPTLGEMDGHPCYIGEDGTSISSPFVTGVVAHMFEVNPDLTPRQVKNILMDTAEPLAGVEAEAQGRGAIQPQLAIAEALRLRSVGG